MTVPLDEVDVFLVDARPLLEEATVSRVVDVLESHTVRAGFPTFLERVCVTGRDPTGGTATQLNLLVLTV